MNCPLCGEPESIVAETRCYDGENVMRRRSCACGHRWTTREVIYSPTRRIKTTTSGITAAPQVSLSSSGSSLSDPNRNPSKPLLQEVVKKTVEPTGFRDWYGAYPLHVGRRAAAAAWERTKGDRPPMEQMLSTLAWQRVSEQWRGGFIPHPATYLNQGRWADERRNPGSTGAPLRAPSGLCAFHDDTRTANRPARAHDAACSECRHVAALRRSPSSSEPIAIGDLSGGVR